MKGLRLTERGWAVVVTLVMTLMSVGLVLLAVHALDAGCDYARSTGTGWRIERSCGGE